MHLKEDDNDNSVNNINKNLRNETLSFEGDPATISAFAVYEKNKTKKKARKKSEDEEVVSNRKKTTTSNPLLVFLEAGKLLGLYGLSKIVDCFRYFSYCYNYKTSLKT